MATRHFYRKVVGGAVVVALVLGYLGYRYRSPNTTAPLETVSIAVPSVPHAALLYIAAANGYFAAEGLEVAMMSTIHGKAALEFLEQGKADLGAASDVVFALAILRDEDLAIAANMLNSSNDLAVIARRDRDIAMPRDLVGKRVGVTLGTAGEYFLWAFLVRHKLPTGSVVLVDMPPGQLVQELVRGNIDAVATWQPNVVEAQLALSGHGVTFFEPLAYIETFNIVGRRNFLKEHSKKIEKLMRALLKAEQFNLAHTEEAVNLVAKQLEVDVNSMRSNWKIFNFRIDLQQSQLIALEDEARWAFAGGYFKTGPIPNFLPTLYLDALRAVAPERVTVVR